MERSFHVGAYAVTIDEEQRVLVCRRRGEESWVLPGGSSEPGEPPLETVVAFWTADERRHQFKLYKPLREVLYDDVGWLMGSPQAHDGSAWDCC